MARNTESFITYFNQREALTNYLQVGTAAMELLLRNVTAANGPNLLGAFVDACAVSHWGKGKRYPNQIQVVTSGKAEVAHHGIIRHAAAFDNFSRNLVTDSMRFSESARRTLPKLSHDHSLLTLSPQKRWVVCPCCNQVVDKIGSLAERLETLQEWLAWKPTPKLRDTFPLFHLMRRIRNRIAHYDSMVGAELEEYSKGKEVEEAVRHFQKHYSKRTLPALPTFRRGERVMLEAVNSIMFGAVLYVIAKEMNEHAVSLMEDFEFIDMAFFYSSAVEEHSFRTVRHRAAEGRIAYFLDRYLRRDPRSFKPKDISDRLSRQHVSDSGGSATSLWAVALKRHRDLLAND
ncbi:hypothetical protein ACU8OG_20740 [Rhizobium leguminosarum]